jgi:hypothetical protein
MGLHSSHFVPKRTGPSDEILNKLWPHNHIGYVWLIHHLLDNIHICNNLIGLFASTRNLFLYVIMEIVII